MEGKEFRINCGSKYFDLKYGPSAIIKIECESDFHHEWKPASLLYVGRVLAEGRVELLRGKTYYGHVNGEGEFIHYTEVGEEIKQ